MIIYRLPVFLFFVIFVFRINPAYSSLFDPQIYRLSNDMEVIVIENHRAPVVAHMIWYKVGAADEPPGKSGVAHFLEHLLFKGTEKIPPGQFSKIIARNGGRDNAFTSYDYTGYYQNVARAKLSLVMGMEADRMVNLRLSENDIETERAVVLEERRARIDNNPSSLLSEVMNAAQFQAHPYGIPVIGWKHEIEKLELKDVLTFYRQYYAPNNAILVVAGDVQFSEVIALANKHFGSIPRSNYSRGARPQEPEQLAERRVIFRDGRVRQADWRRSYLSPTRSSGHKEYAIPLILFSDLLGGGTTSWLYQSLVVEKKLATSVGAHYTPNGLDQGIFLLFATPTPGVDLEILENAIEDELSAVMLKGFTKAALERTRSSLLAAAVYARDNLFTAPRIFGRALTSGLTVEQVENWPNEVKSVTMDMVMGAGRAVLDKRRSVTGILLPKHETN